ncbi:MAG: hypothetical protein EB086_06795 [Rhodobacteraceae bacterium]|nr:hypothetical protein [Paracoccaceae bacterium]
MQTRIAPAINDRLRGIPSWSVYLVGPLPAVWYFWLGFNAQLGPNPISKLEHLLGEFALQLLIIGLAITPLRRLTYINLLKFRRAIGLLAFFYVLLHLLVWLVLDIQILSQILADILKRPYITVGMVAINTQTKRCCAKFSSQNHSVGHGISRPKHVSQRNLPALFFFRFRRKTNRITISPKYTSGSS